MSSEAGDEVPSRKSRTSQRAARFPRRGTAADTRWAAERFREVAGAIVVLGADGECELEVVDETVEFWSIDNAPRLATFEVIFEEVAQIGLFERR